MLYPLLCVVTRSRYSDTLANERRRSVTDFPYANKCRRLPPVYCFVANALSFVVANCFLRLCYQGSILKPREVRTLRRTAKDCVTFIPFMIILIIPLSPGENKWDG